MSKTYFHFTLGPVQGFVAQARRTRDFWAGSFILSWLSAVAMKAVMVQNGTILFPAADEHFLQWLEGRGSGVPPEQGAVPNRFMACAKAGHLQPELVLKSVHDAWKTLADTVFANDLEQLDHKGHLSVWQNQVASFWDMCWIVADDPSDSSALDQRKNWRSHLPPEQEGVKCMMMDGLQELSGVPSPTKPHGEQLTQFWSELRQIEQPGMKTDLRPGEHLCAIAFIKRRFPHYFHLVRKEMPGGWTLQGWPVEPGRPSVAYMAAVHWLEHAIRKTDDDADVRQKFESFHQTARELTQGYGEWRNNIQCVQKAGGPKRWTAMDGNVFFESMLANENIYETHRAPKTIRKLKALQKAADLGPPTPFYAVLMMDGDSLGVQMSDPEKQPGITAGLKEFTRGVPQIAKENNGFLIYAGGDDVLAVLPLEDAMTCALQIRQYYLSCFEPWADKVHTTLSGAIEYAHIKMPLTKVLKDAHCLLDDVAKDGCGRDALAVRVWKPGGKTIQWAMPWAKALNCSHDTSEREDLVLAHLARALQNDDDRLRQYSSRFFYKIRERFELLNPADSNTERIITHEQAELLMATEYISSGLCDKYPPEKRMDHALAIVRPMFCQCSPVYRDSRDPKNIQYRQDETFYADGALLVRFLAKEGMKEWFHDQDNMAL
jgi:CRISPR-associated protein Cmr2